MLASELKADRKLDILSRTLTPAPKRATEIASRTGSPDDPKSPIDDLADLSTDTSDIVDETFASATEGASEVASQYGEVITRGRISDPFLVPLRIEHDLSEEVEEIEAEKSLALPDVYDMSADLSSQVGNSTDELANASLDEGEDESHEVRATKERSPTPDSVRDDDSASSAEEKEKSDVEEERDNGGNTTRDTNEAAFDPEAEEEDEAELETEDDEFEGESDSSFCESEAAFSTEEDSPIRRASGRRRTTGKDRPSASAVKPVARGRAAILQESTSSSSSASPAFSGFAVASSLPTSKADTTKVKRPSAKGITKPIIERKPLGERSDNIVTEVEEDDVEIVAPASVKTKKRRCASR